MDLLRAKTDVKNASGEDWLSQQFHQKIKDHYSVFVHQQNVRKRKRNNLKINSSASFHLKSRTFKSCKFIFVSNFSRGQNHLFGARDENQKGKSILMAQAAKSWKGQ